MLKEKINKQKSPLLCFRKGGGCPFCLSLLVLGFIAPLMLGEDFSWYQKEVPGVFAFVGCGTPGRKCYPNHHPKFEVEESALLDGVLLHLAAVVSAMHREKEE